MAASFFKKRIKLNSCCGCVSLQTGTIIIGVLDIIILIGQLIEVAVKPNSVWISSKWDIDPTTGVIILVISAVLLIITYILLLVGTYMKNANMMLPWLILDAIVLVMVLVTGFKCLYSIPVRGIPMLVMVAVFVYLWLVVYSHYQEVK